MLQVSLARGWDLEVERGPDCLFVRPRAMGATGGEAPVLAEQLWSLLEQNFSHRLVLELDAVELDGIQLDGLNWLARQINSHGGMLRICGLSQQSRAKMHDKRLLDCGQYRDRTEAVMSGSRALPPR